MKAVKSPLYPQVGVMALVPDRWGPQWQARHHIVTRLTQYFEVLWVEDPPYWRKPFSSHRDGTTRGQCEAPFQIYSPRLPEFGHPAWLANLRLRERLKRARRQLLHRGCKRIVIYMWRPRFAAVLDCVPHELSCYHIDDEYSFSAQERAIDFQEARAIQIVGQVFIHSSAMMRKKGHLNPFTEHIPNGVDFRRYATAVPEPEDLRRIPRPRMGYAGVLKKQLNWPLLLELASRHPEWSFVFAGGMKPGSDPGDAFRILSTRSNVHLLGSKSTEELACYPQHFDVCMLPYLIDGYTKYIYPLKLHEYLASGTAVVGSPIPSLQEFENVATLADGPEKWSAALSLALAENSSQLRQARQAVARQYDWEILVGRIAGTILRRLGIPPTSEGQQSGRPAVSMQEAELRN